MTTLPGRMPARGAVGWLPVAIAAAVALMAAGVSIVVSLAAARSRARPPDGMLPMQGPRSIAAEASIPLSPFSLTDQKGLAFDSAAMRGAVWVVDFIFTRCPGPCRAMTTEMARIVRERKGDHRVRFLTITVDPEHDTPEILANYAREFDSAADPAGRQWTFVTGRKNDVYRIIRDVFKLPVEELEVPGEHGPIAHSTRFVLVDDREIIRGYFDGLHPGGRERLERAIEMLLGGR